MNFSDELKKRATDCKILDAHGFSCTEEMEAEVVQAVIEQLDDELLQGFRPMIDLFENGDMSREAFERWLAGHIWDLLNLAREGKL